MNDINALVDIESDGIRQAFVARTPLIDQRVGKAYRIA